MGKIKKQPKVKLVAGFIFKQEDTYKKAKSSLEKLFGEADFESPEIAFIHTDYYEKEFGKSLKRRFLSFRKLVSPDSLPKIKLLTNRIENKLSREEKRLINIDPGYVDMAKLVLASTKDFSHRIYLSKGIFAEITLCFRGDTFKTWEWTYPDYRTREYIEIFNKIRESYISQIRDTL
ncbi:MAG: DUF4416 family protein [Candidatus Omnitrophica bacterium]|nr:DUF4416 family protein [Candidatus Omnitrophota bacterium]